MAEDWVRLQLGMRLQIGVLRYTLLYSISFMFSKVKWASLKAFCLFFSNFIVNLYKLRKRISISLEGGIKDHFNLNSEEISSYSWSLVTGLIVF